MLSRKELTVAGAVLYCCEGTKLRRDKRRKNNVYYWVVEFTNSDPRIIKLFLEFLRKVIIIDKTRLKAQLFIYEDLVVNKLLKYWSTQTKIPLENFNKVIILKSNSTKFKMCPYGTIKIRYHSKEAFQKLDSIINGILE